MIIYVCKMCGRAIKAETKPNFCYFDRMSSIENISDEDAIKMGLFSFTKGCPITFPKVAVAVTPPASSNIDSTMETTIVTFEFPKDIKYNPFTGRETGIIYLYNPLSHAENLSLTDFQNMIMRRVINANK